ncbi:MAG: alkylation response protein AidB-like acyl-CoA dehydrogenase [Paracoccaceae bacterium]|jgi:alkylation response protein AidB-like acyl-CoA dehydrogenase
MPYAAPLRDLSFCLHHVIDAGRLSATERFAHADADTLAAVLKEAGKLAAEVFAPLNRNGDRTPAKLENGVVRTSPGFKEALKAFADGGWAGVTASESSGGMGLPITIGACINEMNAGANMAIGLCPLLTQGQIEALEHHASDALKAIYLPKLTSGEWTGTMNLTEPAAGSDVGALRSKAVPGEDGAYAISGQKIYISWGDHDAAENVCHLVLARLPDGKPGTKGISLFLVPKFIPNADGSLGAANSLRVVSLEHKLGIHGSPTCVMEFDGATGWLVGEEHDGMAAMFTMMNNARLNVGVQGVGIAEAATQKALAYALDRRQGRTPVGDGMGGIADHADVRRMLLTMRAQTEAARALALDCAISLDLANAAGDAEARAAAKARGAFLTPIAKSYGTDAGCEVADMGIQIHGGMGFIEETGAAQYLRDVRVTTIYEGTNGIQAMDLVGRKLMDGGAAARDLLAEVQGTAAALTASPGHAGLGAILGAAATAVGDATEALLAAGTINDRFAGAVAYQRMWALALGGHYLGKGALAAAGGPEEDRRAAIARFFIGRIVPQAAALAASATAGAADLYTVPAEALA